MSDRLSLMWGMRWAARTLTHWIALFGYEKAERMAADAEFQAGLGCDEHRAALRTAWGR